MSPQKFLQTTGVNVKAGKNIKILDNGFKDFGDYWTDQSESEADESVVNAIKNIESPVQQVSSTIQEKQS